jgi:hypothetical protein
MMMASPSESLECHRESNLNLKSRRAKPAAAAGAAAGDAVIHGSGFQMIGKPKHTSGFLPNSAGPSPTRRVRYRRSELRYPYIPISELISKTYDIGAPPSLISDSEFLRLRSSLMISGHAISAARDSECTQYRVYSRWVGLHPIGRPGF